MVDFALTEEQLAIQKLARDFAEKEIKPVAMERDRIVDPKEAFPVDIFKKSFELGFHKAFIPTKYGGLGLDCLTCLLIWEELAVGDAGVCVSFQGHALALEQTINSGTEEQRETFLGAVTEGEGCLTALSFTEPNVGPCWLLVFPDYAMETTAVLQGDDYVLNGTKNFVTNGGTPLTKWYVIHARTDMTKGGLAAHNTFFVWADTPGLNVGKAEDKMGQRLSHNVVLYLDDLRVPKGQLLGGVTERSTELFAAERERLTTVDCWVLVGGLSLGIARAAYEAALDYAKQRLIAGRPSIQYQLVGAKLAEMYINIEAARALAWKAARHSDTHPRSDWKLAFGTKILTSDVAVKVSSEAVQIYGGYGYTKENLVEKLYRDAKVTQIYECPNELLKVTIASMLELGA